MLGRKKLGEVMLDMGLINRDQLHTALEYGKLWRMKIGQSLVVNRFVNESQLRDVLSAHLGVQTVDLRDLKVTEALLKSVPKDLAVKHEIFPLGYERSSGRNVLKIATSDPMNLAAISEVEFASCCKVEPYFAEQSQLVGLIRSHYLKVEKEAISFEFGDNQRINDFDAAKKFRPLEIDLADLPSADTPFPNMAAPVPPVLQPIAQAMMQPGEFASGQQELVLKALLKLLVKKNIVTREELAKELEGL